VGTGGVFLWVDLQILVVSPSPAAIAVGIRRLVVSPSRRSDSSLICALQDTGVASPGRSVRALRGCVCYRVWQQSLALQWPTVHCAPTKLLCVYGEREWNLNLNQTRFGFWMFAIGPAVVWIVRMLFDIRK
jgi:hypothetical protein